MAARSLSTQPTMLKESHQDADERIRHDVRGRTAARARAGARTDRHSRVLAFPARRVLAVAAAVALLLGAVVPAAQDAAAHTSGQVDLVQGGVERATSAGFEYENSHGVDPAPVYENTEIVPASSNASGDIQPAPGGIQPAQ